MRHEHADPAGFYLNFPPENLKAFLNELADGFIVLDREWRYVFLNQKASAMARRDSADLIGKNIWEEFPALASSKFYAELQRCRAENTVVHFEEHQADLGSWFGIDAYPSQDGITIFIRDITQRKLAEESLGERVRVFAFSARVAQALTTATTLPVMLQQCCEVMVQELDAAFARVWTLGAGDVLELQASAGLYTHLDGEHARVPVGTLKIGLIAKERKPHLTNSVIGDERVGNQEWAKREGMVAFAGYPLIVEDRLVGVMAIFARKPLSQVILEAMAAVADGVALGIQRKRIEEELRENEELYRLTAESASDGIVSIDSESVMHSVNRAMTQIFGYAREELIGLPLTRLMPERFRDAHLAGFKRYQKTKVRKLTWSGLEVPGLHKDGREIGLEVSFGELSYRGQPLFTGVIRDVTHRKQAERRMATQHKVTGIFAESKTIEAIPLVIEAICEGMGWDLGAFWIVDERTQRLTYLTGWHRESASLHGFETDSTPLSFAVGEGLGGEAWAQGEAIWIPDFKKAAYRRSATAQRYGVCSALAFPIRVEHKVTGVLEFMSCECLPVDNETIQTGSAIAHQAGQFLGRLRAEEDRARKAAELAQSNADLEHFAAIASHDLKEPLRTIGSYIELLRKRYKDRLDGNADEYMNFVVDGAKRMTALLDSLMLYSGVEQSGQASEAVSLEEVLKEVRLNLHLSIQRTLTVITHDPLPRVMGDKAQLIQLFQNLAGNSIKYRSQAAPRIHISAEAAGEEWKIGVRDNGIGMDAEYHDTIFDVFRRLHGRDIPGAGLGLAICKRIVERHGGRIWVRSEAGKGATVYFTLSPASR